VELPRVGDDRLGTPLLDLPHEVPAEAVGTHPLEHLDRRPVPAQPDLEEPVAAHRSGLVADDSLEVRSRRSSLCRKRHALDKKGCGG
jgi:hypothetical protein